MYGRIVQDVPTLAGSTTAGYSHYLGTNDFCAFLVQDMTTVPSIPMNAFLRPWPVKTGTDVSIQRAADGQPNVFMDIVAITPHSILDAGPIVPLDVFKTSTSIRTDALTRRGRAPSYRSLHHVRFTPTGGATAFVDVIHNLGTDNVHVFIQPTGDLQPAGQPLPSIFWADPSAAGTVRIHAAQPGLPTVQPATAIDADVMIITPLAIGHTIVEHDRTALARLPSYWTVDSCETIPVAPPPGVYRHNLNGIALTALMCFKASTAVPEALGIFNRGDYRDIQLCAAIVGIVSGGAAQVVFRSHSIFNLV